MDAKKKLRRDYIYKADWVNDRKTGKNNILFAKGNGVSVNHLDIMSWISNNILISALISNFNVMEIIFLKVIG